MHFCCSRAIFVCQTHIFHDTHDTHPHTHTAQHTNSIIKHHKFGNKIVNVIFDFGSNKLYLILFYDRSLCCAEGESRLACGESIDAML